MCDSINIVTMHGKILLVVCALTSGLVACKKIDSTTLVEGQVIVDATQQPLPQAQVQVWQAGPGFSSGYSEVGNPHEADAQGRFAFQIPTGQAHGFILRASRAPGYVTNWGYEVPIEEGRKNRDLRLRVQAPAWLRIRVQDIPPVNEARVGLSGFGGQLSYFAQAAYDTTVIVPCQAGAVQYSWSISQVRGSIYQTNIVQVAPLDTASVKIKY